MVPTILAESGVFQAARHSSCDLFPHSTDPVLSSCFLDVANLKRSVNNLLPFKNLSPVGVRGGGAGIQISYPDPRAFRSWPVLQSSKPPIRCRLETCLRSVKNQGSMSRWARVSVHGHLGWLPSGGQANDQPSPAAPSSPPRKAAR